MSSLRGRDVLVVVALIIGGAFLPGCASTQPTPVNADTVYCPPLHVTITKPAGWRFVPAAEVREAQRSLHSTNPMLNYVVYQSAIVPFVTLTREQPIVSDLPPHVSIYRESLEEDRLASSEKVLGMEMWGYLHVMTGAHIVAPTVHVKVAGEDYAYNRLRYPVRTRSGGAYEIERRFWVRSSAISAVIISASFDMRDSGPAEDEIEQIVRSIAPASAPPASAGAAQRE